eukprot:3431818-Pleurochrysis_carterae.AAC.1
MAWWGITLNGASRAKLGYGSQYILSINADEGIYGMSSATPSDGSDWQLSFTWCRLPRMSKTMIYMGLRAMGCRILIHVIRSQPRSSKSRSSGSIARRAMSSWVADRGVKSSRKRCPEREPQTLRRRASGVTTSQSRSGSSPGGQKCKACERQQHWPCIADLQEWNNLTAPKGVLVGEVAIDGAEVLDGVGFGDAINNGDIDVA